MSKIRHKTVGNVGLFDSEGQKEKLSKLGDPLEKLHKVIDFELFMKELESKLINQNKKSNADSKPYEIW